MQSARVGIREFRENLASYIESSTPVAITRHGETVGFYVPARRKRQQADLDALRKAGEQLDALIAAAGAGEDELVDGRVAERESATTEALVGVANSGPMISVKGHIIAGVGDFQKRMTVFADVFEQATGQKLFPGTLN